MNNRRQNTPKDDSPLFSVKSERMVVGEALQNTDFFWEQHGRIKAHYFTVPRLARIWEAMVAAVAKGRPPTRTWVPLHIVGDRGEDETLEFAMNLLVNDAMSARENGDSDIGLSAAAVVDCANKRALLDSLDAAKAKILKSDFGVAPEHLQDIAMKAIANSIDQDFDKDLRSYQDWADDAVREAQENIDRGEEDSGIGLPPGLRAVEEVIGRLLPGKLYVVAGMSGSGKSALARQIAEAAMKDAVEKKMGGGYIASLEMTGKEYAIRALSERIGIPGDQIERGAMDRSQISRLADFSQDLRKLNIVVDSKTNMTIDEIKARALKTKIKFGGLAIMVIDHLIIIGGEKGEGLFDKVSSATIKAKNMAKEFGIPVILLAQLDEKKILDRASLRPNASDLFGGQTIKQNADVVCFVHRDELVLPSKEPSKENADAHAKWVTRMDNAKGRAVCFNDKRRGGEGRVSRDMRFFGPTMHFEDI